MVKANDKAKVSQKRKGFDIRKLDIILKMLQANVSNKSGGNQ